MTGNFRPPPLLLLILFCLERARETASLFRSLVGNGTRTAATDRKRDHNYYGQQGEEEEEEDVEERLPDRNRCRLAPGSAVASCGGGGAVCGAAMGARKGAF